MLKPHSIRLWLAALAVVLAPLSAIGAGWGSIKGRIVVAGVPPKPPVLVVNCLKPGQTLPNEQIVVGQNNELANAFVYLRLAINEKVEIHSNYQAKLKTLVKLDNKNCQFVPHAIAARVGQEIEVSNADPFGHNTNINALGFNQIVVKPVKVPVTKKESLPQEIACNIHPWMKAYVLLQDHPYMAVTGTDGKFEIKDIPAGEHNFQFWHDTGYLKNAKLGSLTTDKKGQLKITIKAGDTIDLGDVKVKL